MKDEKKNQTEKKDLDFDDCEKAIIGSFLKPLKDLVIALAEQKKRVLLIGDTGTGKELFANLYCAASDKKDTASLNCASFSGELLMSELFGHKKGAFSGAICNRPGLLIENALDKVIFLDEIGDASELFQANVLRLLENGEYRPVGEDKSIDICYTEELKGKLKEPDDLMIFAATSKPDNLRVDLKHRFHVLRVPTLKERKEGDIIELVKYFLCKPNGIEKITKTAFTLLTTGYSWPGNVRELKNKIDMACTIAKMKKRTYLELSDIQLYYKNKEFFIDNEGKKYEGWTETNEMMKINELSGKESNSKLKYFFNEKPFDAREWITEAELKSHPLITAVDKYFKNIFLSDDFDSMMIGEYKFSNRQEWHEVKFEIEKKIKEDLKNVRDNLITSMIVDDNNKLQLYKVGKNNNVIDKSLFKRIHPEQYKSSFYKYWANRPGGIPKSAKLLTDVFGTHEKANTQESLEKKLRNYKKKDGGGNN